MKSSVLLIAKQNLLEQKNFNDLICHGYILKDQDFV